MEESSPPPPPTTVRRNPYRRARNTPFVPSTVACFDAAAVASTLQPFSLDEAPEAVPLPPTSPSPAKPSDPTTSSNLKVFLRIRPAEIKPQPRLHLRAKNPNPRARTKESPQKPKRKKKTELCLSVNGPESVTLTIPKSKLVDSKRGNKSEVYDGFSYVFHPESLQTDVYDKVMNPLVEDFMGGKSALLVAMGPTGSGKTHTMFGTNREPGLIPLALRRIFCNAEKDSSQPRSFYLAMLEIYSVSGKGEKMIDLLSDGAELTLVQSTIKGLEEVPVSDLEGAERLVARGMSKRSTAATDANSQSSRSQCIITIRRANDVFNPENDMSFCNGVLVIADLAGAERDKKTGNMGSRIGESHFINNTSMVFGLCLRSLLEHQKKPKRPLEMHYKSSLLTRYLKEYLEGKKRMTLILTVKPGEDDYVDTSFVLRQAAPYMKIKYTNIEEVSAPPPVQKRNYIAVAQQGYKKRRKVDRENGVDSTEAVTISEKANSEKLEVVQPTGDPIIEKTTTTVDTISSNGGLNAELQQAKRHEVIMTLFARAFWKNLKLYKDKLLKSENEVQSMRGIIIEKNRRIIELEEELAKVISLQKRSELIDCQDENDAGNIGSVSELTETMDDSINFKSSGYKKSSVGSRNSGTLSNSSNSATASSHILLENNLLSDCEQTTVPLIKKENKDKHSENILDEVTEKVCISFISEPECFLNCKAKGDSLEMVYLDANTDEGQMPSTENETQSDAELIEAGLSKVVHTSPSLEIEAGRRSFKFTRQYVDSSECGNAEGSDGKPTLSFEGSTALPSEDSDASAFIDGKFVLLSDFEQAILLRDDKKIDKKSDEIEEKRENDTCCNYITGKQFNPNLAEGDPLQMVCPDSDTDEGKYPSTENFICQSASLSGDCSAEVSEEKVLCFNGLKENKYGDINPLQMVCPDSDTDEGQVVALENEPKPYNNNEKTASEIADDSPCSPIEARTNDFEFISAFYSGGDTAEESGSQGDLSCEDLTREPKNDILEQRVAEAETTNSISLLNLCQAKHEAEVVNLMNCEMHDECNSSKIMEKEGNCSDDIDLDRHEFLPNLILREKPISKDNLLEMVCPDSDAEEEMLSTEQSLRHIEAEVSDIANLSPLVTETRMQSSEFFTQKTCSSPGGYFADGSEARKALSFGSSTDEASDSTSEYKGTREDAASSTIDSISQEVFQHSQAEEMVKQLDLMVRSPPQLNQHSGCSSEESKQELENKRNVSYETQPRERHYPVDGNTDLPVNVGPKKDISYSLDAEIPSTSLHNNEESSIERRKENQPIKSLMEVVGKENSASPSKPFIARKPKRRLRPASSMLLKEFISPDMDPDIPKEGRGKTLTEETTRSEGSMSLIQILTRPMRDKNI